MRTVCVIGSLNQSLAATPAGATTMLRGRISADSTRHLFLATITDI